MPLRTLTRSLTRGAGAAEAHRQSPPTSKTVDMQSGFFIKIKRPGIEPDLFFTSKYFAVHKSTSRVLKFT